MVVRSAAWAAFAAIAGSGVAFAQNVGPDFDQAVRIGVPVAYDTIFFVGDGQAAPPIADAAPAGAEPVNADKAEQAAAPAVTEPAKPAPKARLKANEVRDPWEKFNRRLYATNVVIDRYVVEPAAKAYRALTPKRLRRGIANMIDNLDTPKYFANNVLQGHPAPAAKTVFRFIVNSTIGIGGFFDVAAKIGVQRRAEDFGQTLAVWGAPAGPYMFLPVTGPTTVRDLFGSVADLAFNPFNYVQFSGESILRGLRFGLTALSAREGAIEAIDSIKASAADPYTGFKAAYIQNRAYEIRNGKQSLDDLPDFGEDPENPSDSSPATPVPPPPEPPQTGSPAPTIAATLSAANVVFFAPEGD